MSYFSRSLVVLSLSVFYVSSVMAADNKHDSGKVMQQLQQSGSLDNSGGFFERLFGRKKNSSRGEDKAGNIFFNSKGNIKISKINFEGNTIFSDEYLSQQVRTLVDYENVKHSRDDLELISLYVTAHYRSEGYGFAIAKVISSNRGVLSIRVNEGLYGNISISNSSEFGDVDATKKEKIKSTILAYFESMKSSVKDADGNVSEAINTKKLTRTAMILEDMLGYKISTVVKPSKKRGRGDIIVTVEKAKSYSGSVSINNHGNRYLGTFQAMANLSKNNTFRFGDEINLVTLKSQGDLWYGSVGYKTPIAHSGLVGGVGYSRANYELGKEYTTSDVHGDAETANVNLSYPLVKSRSSSLNLTTSYNHKWFTSKTIYSRTKKSSDVLPIGVNFFKKDSVLGGGVTYGSTGFTLGVLHLDNSLKSTDDSSARTDGEFSKFNFDVSRIQSANNLVNGVSIFARGAGQFALDNLDSSESFGIGGPNAVRAYPVGEGFGDEGYLGQFELRYSLGSNFTPFVLYDVATVRTNHNAYDSTRNDRSLSGYGLGLKYRVGQWNAVSTIAWRKTGGEPTSDNKDKTPMIWITGGYSF